MNPGERESAADDELNRMEQAYRSLQPLDRRARSRAVRWLRHALLDSTPPPPPRSRARENDTMSEPSTPSVDSKPWP